MFARNIGKSMLTVTVSHYLENNAKTVCFLILIISLMKLLDVQIIHCTLYELSFMMFLCPLSGTM